MMTDRRNFIGMLAAATSAAALTGPATAAASFGTPRLRKATAGALTVIETGLPTDAAFARGAGATQTHRFSVSVDSYFDLLARFEERRTMPLLAFVRPADSILIEQALRDGGGRLLERRSLRAPALGDQLAWAHQVGALLAGGVAADQWLSFDGHPFIAIVAGL